VKSREIGNLFLHLGVGLGLTLAACWSDWMLIPGTFVYAWLREQAQHRYIIGKPYERLGDSWMQTVQKRTFWDFGWMTWHSMFEVLQWTLGAAVACGVWNGVIAPLQ